MTFSAQVVGHLPGPRDSTAPLVKIALEHLATDLKDAGGGGTISFNGQTLHFRPGDNLVWD